jgi:hypothetical protein
VIRIRKKLMKIRNTHWYLGIHGEYQVMVVLCVKLDFLDGQAVHVVLKQGGTVKIPCCGDFIFTKKSFQRRYKILAPLHIAS